MLTNNADYNRDADVMFWWLIGTVVGLSVLSIVLHHDEEGQEGKARSVRLFFAFESLISLIGAWKAASGKPWF
jgi:hypothetical protein